MQQPIISSNAISSQPVAQQLLSQSIMSNVGNYSGDPSFSQSPAPSQPQIPTQTSSVRSCAYYDRAEQIAVLIHTPDISRVTTSDAIFTFWGCSVVVIDGC